MSGPAYPPGPQPGSNSIGTFVIGVSPIGTINPFDYWRTIMSQYANSPRLTQLIANMDQYLDQTENFDDFYDLIWNVVTAQGYGLDVWGRIVGVSRAIAVPSVEYLGFEEADSGTAETFGFGIFYSGETITSNFLLPDPSYRLLILAKAASNICDGSIPAINQMMLNLFPGRGNCYVANAAPLNIVYTFDFTLTPVELAIVSSSGVFPTPAGVAATISSM